MIAHVVPLVRLPRGIGYFDYRLPPEIKLTVGSAVRIRFRKRAVIGIVTALVKESTIPLSRLLPIEAVLSAQPLVTDAQRQLAAFLSQEGFSSLALAYRSMVPKLTLRKTFNLPALPDSADRPLNQAPKPVRPEVVTYSTDRTLFTYMRRLVQAAEGDNRSVMIIAPTEQRARTIAAELPAVELCLATTPTAERNRFIQLRSARSSIIVGTRSAIFAPLNRIGLILIDQEDADEHIQEEPNPRYDVRALALILARSMAADVVLTSRFPSLATWKAYGPGLPLDEPPDRSIKLIDLETARRGKDYAIVTETATTDLAAVLQRDGQAAVIHPHRTTFSALSCGDCGLTFNCPVCEVPFHQDGPQLRCTHCGTLAPIPLRCPRCGGYRLRGRGRGLDHLQRELASELKTHSNRLTIMTAAQAHSLPDQSHDVIVLTNYDSLLAVPRADADETARRIIITLLAKLKSKGQLIVQGSRAHHDAIFHPENDWREKSFAQRQAFGYPPAWRLFLLRHRAQSRGQSQSALNLVKQLRAQDKKITITGPEKSAGRSRANPAGERVLIRTTSPLMPAIKALLTSLDDSWTITVDPREIR